MEEEEDPFEYVQTQTRYANGYRVTESEVHGCDEDGLYVNEMEFHMPPTQRQLISSVWTPDQYTGYSVGSIFTPRPLTGRNR